MHNQFPREVPLRQAASAILPLQVVDPTGLMQRAMAGLPTAIPCVEQLVLAWLMTLPPEVDPPRAARSLLAGRLPCCCRSVQPPMVREVRELLRLVASYRPVRVRENAPRI
ncbi:hypothetical protein DF3PA_170069 [Candidatus Defluviicoccus seviourii]|uniref:Uncharacterized protein n=2 Tax=root TaxID=1 RepID=A0A564WDB9_9PROT|nr:hypothetical protein DF3PB_80014 [uncultured Defluviicoccus sp.]VUX45968.1 hypothetical protein DF3PA_170069 [Candidatus Defluviicoccus seviourii]